MKPQPIEDILYLRVYKCFGFVGAKYITINMLSIVMNGFV